MAENRLTARDLRGIIIFAALVYLAIVFIGAIAKVIVVFSIILLLTLILNPVVTWLERCRIPRFVSALVIAILLLGLLALIAWAVVPRVIAEFSSLISHIPGYLARLRDWTAERFPDLARQIPVSSEAIVRRGLERIVPLLGGITGYALSLADVLVSAFIIFISTIYSLSNPRPMAQGFLALFPQRYRPKVIETTYEISLQMRAWAFGTLIAMAMIFGLTWIALTLLKVQASFLLGLFAGVMEVVPVLGPVISGAFAVLVALGQSPILALWVLIVFIGIQQVEGHLIIPLVMSSRLQLHPVSVIFAVLVMGGLFGLVGVFLATPAAAIVKVLVSKFYLEPTESYEKETLPAEAEKIVAGPEQPPPSDEPKGGPAPGVTPKG